MSTPIDHYGARQYQTPSNDKKWIDRYSIPSEEIQYLQQNNPAVVSVTILDLSVAQADATPFQISTSGRGFVFFAYPASYEYSPTNAAGVEPREPNAFVMCRINQNRIENGIPLKSGGGYRGTFDNLYLTWPAQGAVHAKLIVWKYDETPIIQQADFRFSQVEATVIATEAKATVTSTAAVLVAQNLIRKCTTINNQGTVSIFVGGSTVTASAGANPGTEVPPGGVLFYRNLAALFAITSGASNANISINDET